MSQQEQQQTSQQQQSKAGKISYRYLKFQAPGSPHIIRATAADAQFIGMYETNEEGLPQHKRDFSCKEIERLGVEIE
jgi:hypothetical protein